jgi:spermidine synthase
MNGLHLIGDLTGCRCDPQLLLDGESFRAKCIEMVAAAGLTTMDATFHTFDGGGFTGTVVLAESHLAIHTWPERQGLTLDVYVCNYSADNSAKARSLFEQMVEYFQPTEAARHEVDRGEHLLMEPLNESTGFYIKATKQLGQWQTRFQKMAIYDTPHYGKIFRLDGFNMTSEKEEFVYHENLIQPALTAHAAPKKVLIIGGGDGGSSEEALKHPSVEQVTMVEIDGDVIQVAKEHFHAVHQGAFDNPKLRVLVDDGMKFVRETHEKFDLIALDLNDPMGPAEALCPARPAPEHRVPHRAAVHHVHPALRLAVGDGGVLGQARSEGVYRRRDRPPHRGAQAGRPQVLQRRDPRGCVRAAQLRPGPGGPGEVETAGAWPPAGRGPRSG